MTFSVGRQKGLAAVLVYYDRLPFGQASFVNDQLSIMLAGLATSGAERAEIISLCKSEFGIDSDDIQISFHEK